MDISDHEPLFVLWTFIDFYFTKERRGHFYRDGSQMCFTVCSAFCKVYLLVIVDWSSCQFLVSCKDSIFSTRPCSEMIVVILHCPFGCTWKSSNLWIFLTWLHESRCVGLGFLFWYWLMVSATSFLTNYENDWQVCVFLPLAVKHAFFFRMKLVKL